MRKMLAGLMVAAPLVAGLTFGAGSASAASFTCGPLYESADKSDVWITCTSGPGNEYRFQATMCDSHHCATYWSTWVHYGKTSHLNTSGLGFDPYAGIQLEGRTVTNV